MSTIEILDYCLCSDDSPDCGCGPVCKYTTAKTGKCFYFDLDDYDIVRGNEWSVTENGYVRGRVNGVKKYLHTLILPNNTNRIDTSVDHKNNNKLDNRRQNLRLADMHQQQLNKGIRNDNSTGGIGVSFRKAGKGLGRYVSTWCISEGVQKSVSFGVKRYGSDSVAKSLALAHAVSVRINNPYYQI